MDNPLVKVDPGLFIWTIAVFLLLCLQNADGALVEAAKRLLPHAVVKPRATWSADPGSKKIALSRMGGSGTRTSSSIASWRASCMGTIPQ